MEYTYIPTGIKREFVRLVWIATGRGKLSGRLEEDRRPSFHCLFWKSEADSATESCLCYSESAEDGSLPAESE